MHGYMWPQSQQSQPPGQVWTPPPMSSGLMPHLLRQVGARRRQAEMPQRQLAEAHHHPRQSPPHPPSSSHPAAHKTTMKRAGTRLCHMAENHGRHGSFFPVSLAGPHECCVR